MSDSSDRGSDAGRSTQPLASVEGSGDPAETPEEVAQTAATGPRAAGPQTLAVARTGAFSEPLDPRVDKGTQADERAAPTQGRADELAVLDRRLDALERDIGLVRNLAMQMRDGERAWIDDRLRRSGRDLGIGLMVMVLLAAILFAANWWRTDQRFDLIAARVAGLDRRAAAASAALPAPAAPMGAAAQGAEATLAELGGALARINSRNDELEQRLAALQAAQSGAVSEELLARLRKLEQAQESLRREAGENARLAESLNGKVAVIAKGQQQLAGRLDRPRVATGAVDKPLAATGPPPAGAAEVGTAAESQPAAAAPEVEPAASTAAAVLEASRYAIQLIGFRSAASIGPFAHRLGIAGKARYTVTKHKGGDWYVVLLGDYASRAEGEAAAAALPQELRDLDPWVRPLRAGSQMFPID